MVKYDTLSYHLNFHTFCVSKLSQKLIATDANAPQKIESKIMELDNKSHIVFFIQHTDPQQRFYCRVWNMKIY
jgi:hypothetical protein